MIERCGWLEGEALGCPTLAVAPGVRTYSLRKPCELVLKVADVRLEAIILPHFDGEEVVVVLLGFLVRSILGEERLSYLLVTVERT